MIAFTLPHAMRLLATFNVLCFAAVLPRDYVVHQERRSLPSGWKQTGRLNPETVQTVRIALAQKNLDSGVDRLLEISDPNSPSYGKQWTPEEVRDYFSPSNKTVEVVQKWLADSIPSSSIVSPIRQSFNKAWIEFSVATIHLEKLLSAEFYHHEHISGRSMPAANVYHVPMHIRDLVDFIEPGILMASPVVQRSFSREMGMTQAGQSSHVLERDSTNHTPCKNNSLVEPNCIRALYGVPSGPPPKDKSYRHGIYLGDNNKWNQADLDLFFSKFVPGIPAGTHPEQYNIDGAPNSKGPDNEDGGEPLIDLTMAFPLLYPTQLVMVSEDDAVVKASDYPGSLNTMLEAFDESYCTYSAYNVSGPLSPWDPIYPNPAEGGYKGERECGTLKSPSVLAISWGNSEDYFPISWQRRQCNEFMKFGLQGVSIIVSTGDHGVGVGGDRKSDDYCYGPDQNQWAVPWPANCPYVTAVGGTQLTPGVDILHPKGNPEQGLFSTKISRGHNISSAGGVSAIYPRPAYQDAAVSRYLKTAPISTPGYTAIAPSADNQTTLRDIITQLADIGGSELARRSLSGRGTPDISALGDLVSPYVGSGVVWQSGGTSVSAQYIAAFISRINLERFSKGKPTVGFINPVLYQHADTIIRDITVGEKTAACDQEGYPVTKGWDAVTGLGVLKYKEALELWLSI